MAYPFVEFKRKAACWSRKKGYAGGRETYWGKRIKGNFYAELEQFAREKIRGHLQDLLEQEVREWLGREKSERKVKAVEQPGYRNGYGRPRRLAMV